MKFLSMSQTKDFSSAILANESTEFIPTEEKKTKRKRLPKNVGDDDRARKKINFDRANALVDRDWKAIEVVALYAAHKEADKSASDFWGEVAAIMRERGCNRSSKDCSEKWNKAIQEVKLRTKKLKTTKKEKSQSLPGNGVPVRSSPRLRSP